MDDSPRGMRILPAERDLSAVVRENALVTRGLHDIAQLIARTTATALATVEDIHEAVAAGHIEVVRRILDTDPTKADARDGDGWTPLHVAVCHNQPDALKLLLEHGAHMQCTIEGGDVRVLKAGGAEPTRVSDLEGLEDFRGASPLHLAALLGRTACAGVLLSAGADVHAEDAGGYQCLHCAAMSRYYGVSQVQDEQRAEVARQLVTHGADVNAKASYCGHSALHVATMHDDIGFVAWLIRHGADVNARDYDTRFPLLLADDLEIVKLLLDSHADVNATACVWFEHLTYATPLDVAVWKANHPVAQLLVEHGASVDRLNPLYWAARNCDDETVELLLAHGADVNVRGPCHYTALHGVLSGCDWYDPEIIERAVKTVELLLSYGADVNARADHGMTPLDCMTALDDVPGESKGEAADLREFLVARGAYSGIHR